MNNKKILSLALAGVIVASNISFTTFAKNDDNYWDETSASTVNRLVNKVKVYKDCIIINTNNQGTRICFYDDDDNRIIEGSTDGLGNLIMPVEGYHDHLNKDHYLKIDGNKIYLNDDIVERVNGYYYEKNADDDYDPSDADENDARVFPKYDFVNNNYEIKGELKDYANKTVKVYLDDKYIAEGKVDKNENFTIKLPRQMRNKNMLKFYVSYDLPKTEELKVWDIQTTDFSVSGRYNKNVNLKAFYGDKDLGNAVTNENGEFTIETNYRLPRNATVKFYLVDGAVNEVSSHSYIKGYNDNTFRPNGSITRAEASTMMARLMSGNESFANKDTSFSDANNNWYSGAVSYVSEKNVIKGYPNGTFKPENKITRGEFVNMIANYLNEEVDQKSGYRDVEDHWSKDAIDIVSQRGYIKGYPDGYFRPNNEITRAEAVKILNETFSITSNGVEKVNFNDVSSSAWYYKEIARAINN